jgi:transposase-like protein
MNNRVFTGREASERCVRAERISKSADAAHVLNRQFKAPERQNVELTRANAILRRPTADFCPAECPLWQVSPLDCAAEYYRQSCG